MFYLKVILLCFALSSSINAQSFQSYGHNLDNFFDYFVDEIGGIEYNVFNDKVIANLNIIEKKDSYNYYFELAGFKKKDINVTLQNHYLIIETSKRLKNIKKNKNLKYQEILSYSFYRNVKLEKDIHLKNIQVNYNNGILEVIFKKDISKNINNIQTLKIN